MEDSRESLFEAPASAGDIIIHRERRERREPRTEHERDSTSPTSTTRRDASYSLKRKKEMVARALAGVRR